MKKNIYVILLIIFCYQNIICEDNIQTIRQRFACADIYQKEKIIKTIYFKDEKNTIEFYKDVLKFIQNNYEILNENKIFLNIAKIAIEKNGEIKNKNSIADIRYLFSISNNQNLQITCLKALSKLVDKDPKFTNYLNTLYEEGLSNLLSGREFNINLLIAYCEVLENLSEPSSFDILFKTLLYPIDSTLKQAVKKALNNIFFDYFSEIILKMKQKDIHYITTLYELAKENSRIKDENLAKISEVILDFGMKNLSIDSSQSEKLIFQTLPIFSKLKWNKVAKNINKFFFYAQNSWIKQLMPTKELITIINCMANIGTLETAQNLSIFLGLLNSQMENDKTYEEDLILSVINSLKVLGSKIAFDYLLYIEYLDYSSNIKIAAKEAIEGLKW